MDFLTLAKKRYSVRAYTKQKVEKEKLDAKLHEDYDMTLPEAQTMAEAMHWEPVTPENRREVLATQTDCRNRLRAF